MVTRIAQDEKVRYHKLTDKALPTDAEETEGEMSIELEIDAQAPKGNENLRFRFVTRRSFVGNLLYLPSSDEKTTKIPTDDQRAMKQLEVSTKIQTGLELKIEAMRKEIRENERFSPFRSSERVSLLQRI